MSVEKGYEARRPRTDIRLTALGRQRFLDYLAVLEQVVRDAAAAADSAAPLNRSGLADDPAPA